jgi:hypothetical protein
LRSDAEQRVLRNRNKMRTWFQRKPKREVSERFKTDTSASSGDGTKFFDILGKVVKPSNFYLIFLDHKQW